MFVDAMNSLTPDVFSDLVNAIIVTDDDSENQQMQEIHDRKYFKHFKHSCHILRKT